MGLVERKDPRGGSIAIGALRTVSKHLRIWVSKLGIPGIIALLQRACLLETAKILGRTLDN